MLLTDILPGTVVETILLRPRFLRDADTQMTLDEKHVNTFTSFSAKLSQFN